MKSCDLCGADAQDDSDKCARCGFEFPKTISADLRDEAILKKHHGKDLAHVKRELKVQQTRLRAYLENMDARELRKEELVALLDRSLEFLRVPTSLGVEDVLRFSKQEKSFINLMVRILEKADSEGNQPIATSGTYIKMANALQAMGEPEKGLQMIDKALLINPRDDDGLFAKAKLLFYSKEYQGSKRCLEKLMERGGHPEAGYLVELIEQISANH